MSALGDEAPGWNRRRLLAVVLGMALVVVSGLAGLIYAVHGAVASSGTSRDDDGVAVAVDSLPTGQSRRDAIATAPMLRVSPQDSRGGTPAASPAPTIVVPAATRLGPAEVPTGFDHTTEGAVGQLAAIATTVLQGMSIQQVRAVHEQWSTLGAPAVDEWALMAAVRAFLGSDAGPHIDEPGTEIVTVPSAAQIKGSDGDGWVVACVLLDATVTVVTEARAAYGYCERLQWAESRWVIAPGTAPASAPSTWPGTDLAAAAGWRTWTTSTEE
ncbi:hypothetical protein [Pengzhenrongella frigida]|uniref:Uncharacterized protein n=1 Tax=Pengzhenrongella frigida TaxID=1259133 RepID=A0A4Q5N169_9MICO|nr:hypothetical protein [Cellulomonas sp. HLT2-17]RYV51003.1 hypothetical protein EUA98_10875 [Cellulomonas sp. HLT2-17]